MTQRESKAGDIGAGTIRAVAIAISGPFLLAAAPASFAQEAAAPAPSEPAVAGPLLADSNPADPAAPIPPERWYETLRLSGSLSFDYRLRHTSGATDQDLYGLLSADYGDAQSQPVTAHLVARSAYDLDGHTKQTGAYVFNSLEDTYQDRLTAQLYEAWVGGALSGAIASWKAGRFYVDDTPVETYVDGARFETSETAALRMKFGAYGGLPSHLYESSPSGDLILGAFAEARAWRGGRTRLDWMLVEDQQVFADHSNDLYAISQWQQVGERVDLFGRFTFLESESRDLSLRATYADAAAKFHGQLAYFELFNAQKSLAIEFDPYFNSAFDYEPYRQIQLNAGQALGDHLDLSGGFDVRRLTHDSSEGTFNHDFERFYLVPTLIGLPDEGTSITATGELWIATPERFATVGGEIDHEFSKAVKADVGTAYSLYKYDILLSQELDRVRTYYAGIDWKASAKLRLRLEYDWEEDPFDHYQTLRMRATWTF
jgi:hypothetical protein